MLMIEAGIATVANKAQSAKAFFAMLPTDDGIAMLTNELQYLKAHSSNLVTEDGIVTRVTLVLFTPHSLHEFGIWIHLRIR